MKILLLVLFSVIFLTDAVEVTDEDINSTGLLPACKSTAARSKDDAQTQCEEY